MSKAKRSRRQPSEPPLRLVIGVTAVGMIVGAFIAPAPGETEPAITLPSQVTSLVDVLTKT